MSDVRVLDASALLSLVLNEPGAGVVQDMLPDVSISTVNLSEVAAKLSDYGMPGAAIDQLIDSFGLRIEPFTKSLAFEAAELRKVTRQAGLSLGDRACLATARHLGGSAVTTDRAWATIGEAAGVEIELIR